MKWAPHTNRTIKQANGYLGFLRKNFKTCPLSLKETAYSYQSLLRSVLKYSGTIWDPHYKKDSEDVGEGVYAGHTRLAML